MSSVEPSVFLSVSAQRAISWDVGHEQVGEHPVMTPYVEDANGNTTQYAYGYEGGVRQQPSPTPTGTNTPCGSSPGRSG